LGRLPKMRGVKGVNVGMMNMNMVMVMVVAVACQPAVEGSAAASGTVKINDERGLWIDVEVSTRI
jgi:hypothetical protein